MADLFDELWHLVFYKLELADLAACAQVNKKFNLLVKNYRIKAIAFTRGTNFQWFHSVSTYFDPHLTSIECSKATVLKKSSFNFDHLKCLRIGRWSSFDLNDINKFSSLEELDIDLKNYENEESLTLSLPNLWILYVFVPPRIPFLELNTPRLWKVRTFHLEKLEFVYPQSVQWIIIFSHGGNLSTLFPNLQHLIFTDALNLLDFSESHALESFKPPNLTTLMSLKEIGFNYYSMKYVERNMNTFKKTVQRALDLQRPDLKVFWDDFNVTDPNLLTEYQNTVTSGQDLIVFQIRHHEKLKDKSAVWIIGFNSLIKALSESGFDLKSPDLASEALAIFPLNELNVIGRVDEPELLIDFIVKSPNLYTLRFENSGLDPSFFERLLEIIQTNKFSLKLLKIDQQLPPGLITKFLRLPQPVSILISVGKSTIERTSPGRFLVDGKSFDWCELLEHIEAKRNKQNGPSKCSLM